MTCRTRGRSGLALALALCVGWGPNGTAAEFLGPGERPERTPPPPPEAVALPNRDRLGVGFWLAGAGLAASAVFDVESTLATIGRCGRECREGNVLLGGVIDSGRGWSYGVQLALGSGTMALAAKLRHSRHPALRRIWWLPIALVGWGHLVGGSINLGVRAAPADSRP